MEFIDLALLGSAPGAYAQLEFADIKALPKVQVSMDLRPLQTAENLKNLEATLAAGSRVANVIKVNGNAPQKPNTHFPRRILAEMTSVCNVLCKMCPRNNLTRPAIHMATDTYLRVLDEANEHGIEGLWLFNLGESLLHPDFRKIVNHAGQLDKLGYIWMSTNGHLMNESNTRFILDSCIDFINFSLHGTTAETHSKVIPHGNFAKVLKNYETLINLKAKIRPSKPYVHLQMIEQLDTLHEIVPFIEQHCSEVEIVSVNTLEYLDIPANEFGKESRLKTQRSHCNIVKGGTCYVCSNGAVTLCSSAYDCHDMENDPHYLGNIHEQSLHDIWNGEKRRYILEREAAGEIHSLERCSRCVDFHI